MDGLLPWWGWVLAGMVVQDLAALVLLHRLGYRINWEAWRSG